MADYDPTAEDNARTSSIAQAGANPIATTSRPYTPITVANDPELDASVRAGNAAVASRPRAIPNSPVQAASGDRFSGGLYAPLVSAVRGLPDYIHSIGNSQAAPAATPAAPLSVAASTSAPRVAVSANQGGNADTQARDVREPARPTSFTGTGDAVNAPPVQPYGDIVSRASQDMAQNYRAMVQAEDQRRPNSYETDIAKREASMARFDATQGADMILAPNNRGYAQQREAIVQNANRTAAEATRLDNARRAPSAIAPPNLVQNAVAQTDADAKARAGQYDSEKGALASASGKQGLQKGALDIQSHKTLTDLGTRLGAAKTDEERGELSRNILSLLGKDSKRYTITHAAGEAGVDGQGMAFKHADQIVLTDNDTGKTTTIGLSGQSPAQPNAMEGMKVTGKQGTPFAGKTGKIVNGQFVPD